MLRGSKLLYRLNHPFASSAFMARSGTSSTLQHATPIRLHWMHSIRVVPAGLYVQQYDATCACLELIVCCLIYNVSPYGW
jgi:hypothetical protein